MKKSLILVFLLSSISFAGFAEFKDGLINKGTSATKKATLIKSGLKYFKYNKYYSNNKSATLCQNTNNDQWCIFIQDGAKYQKYDVRVSNNMVEFIGKKTRIEVSKKGARVTSSLAQEFGGE